MSRLERYLILTAVVVVCGIAGLWAQNAGPVRTVAEETLHVDASSATVLQWFRKIEREKHIVLSYNASLIDLSRVKKVNASGEMTVGELLELVLDGYVVRTEFVPPRKLMIQVREKESFYVSGTVFEDGSKERLYGAVVSLEDSKGKQWNCISDGNGVFKLYAPEGVYKLSVSYMGYNPYSRQVRVDKDRFFTTTLKPLLFEIEEVTVESNKRSEELGELTPSNMLAFSGNDLFSQIWILPGVTSSLAGSNLQVDGGSNDENQFLLDGVPVFHPGHINSLLPIFNGDAVKNMVFHKGFFDTHLEGRLSSVTEVNLKEGNKQEHVGTLTLDMPAASATLEGPIVKDKLSYMVSARRSWLDFFDRLLSEENRLNHASYDYNAKLSYALSKVSSLSFLAYGARDDYHLPLLDEEENTSVLRWENQVYQLAYHTQAGKLGNRTAVFYSSHTNRARSEMLGTETDGYIRSGIRSVNVSTEFDYAFENIYRAQWGGKYSHEVYELASFDTDAGVRHEPVNQVSLFYDNHIRVSPRLSVQVGVHGVGYLPRNHRPYYSIQPRMSVKYFPGEEDMLYFNFSKMEQFYHCLRLFSWDLPTDFRMPSIDGYKPRSSEHYEAGWKHFLDNGMLEVSAYYKTRRNVVALRPEVFVEDGQWQEYIMVGNGDSYGARMYFFKNWKRWKLQLSYTYARSREWFGELPDNGKMPSMYDIPHQLNTALSYQLNMRSLISVGGMMRSGKMLDLDENFDPLPASEFRKQRMPMNYRIDVGYAYRKSFGKKLLSLRLGLYNVLGNPPEEEILSFYSVHWKSNCLPYAGVSFRF